MRRGSRAGPGLVLGLVLALAGAPARAEEAAAIRRAGLVVDTSGLEGEGPVLQALVRERVGAMLREAEVLPGRRADDAVVSIELRAGESAGGFHYLYAVAVVLGVERQVVAQHSGECVSCTEGEIVGRVIRQVEAMMPRIVEASRVGGEPEHGAGAGVEAGAIEVEEQGSSGGDVDVPKNMVEGPERGPGPVPAALEPTPAPARRVRPDVAAGGGLLGVGVASLGAGIALALREPVPLRDEPILVRTTEPVGVAMACSGGALVVAGAILLIRARVRGGRAGEGGAR